MKLSCDGLALSAAVLKVSKAMPVKKNNSILEGIKMVAKDGFLTLTATDLELSIITRLAADVQIEGEVLVTGKLFADFVKSINEEIISLECVGGKNLTIKYGDNESIIKCMEYDEYPVVDKITEKSHFEIGKDDLKDLINKVSFAASQEDTRPIFKGCLFEIMDNIVTSVALDGYRLSLCKKPCVAEQNGKYIIPARALNEILRIIDEAEDKVKLVFGDEKMMVEIGATQLISRLIVGDYINYRNIIACDFNSSGIFSRDKFAESINRVSIISRSDKNNTVKLELNENLILIDSRSEISNIHETIPAEITGTDCVISFNCRYLQDIINSIDDEYVKINVKTSNSPCIFTPVEGDSYLFLVLPMRARA